MIDPVLLASFFNPMTFDSHRLWMLLPLTLAVAIVYKATRLENIRALPVAATLLWLTIIAGMLAVAVVLYLIIFLFH